MTTTHIVNLVLAVGIVTALAAVCRLAFVAAGRRPAAADQTTDERRLAA